MPPPFTHVVWDDDLEKEPDAAHRIEVGQAIVLQDFADHAKQFILDRTIIERCHDVMFAAVFPRAAGKARGTHPDVNGDVEIGDLGYGTRFGVVPAEFDQCSADLARYIASLDAHVRAPLGDDDFDAVLRVACWLHGEIVRIHPFWNGNGRTARICLNYFSFRYDLQLIRIRNPRDYTSDRGFEYKQANKRYFREHKTDGYEQFFGPMFKP